MSEGQPKPKSRGGHWKRPPTKVYAYNYDVGELYYKPMLNHLDKKSAGLETEVPGPRTFAERLATDPLYNKKKPVDYVTSEIPQAPKKEVSYDDEDKAFRKRLDDILGDYKLEDEAPKRTAERPDRFALPSLSDQILDSAGLSKMRDSIDDRLAEARRRPFREPTPADDDIDALLKKASANRAAALCEENFDKAVEESLSRRRNLLRDLNSELAKIDGEIEQYGSSSRQHQQSRALQARSESSAAAAAAESMMSSSAKMSAMSSTSLNVKQRRVKTTITTETVRC